MPTDDIKNSKTPPSALHVRKGVEGGHDGLPDVDHERNASSTRDRQVIRRTPRQLGVKEYVHGVLTGDRTVLGRAITLVESNATAHQQQAQQVLQQILPRAGKALRVGITGVPGSGKSTLIETLGMTLIQKGHRVAVMAVDPSSSLTRGSILGDKTRMERLSRETAAFIRPSASGGTLGGVARKTRETMSLFEAAGYDVILVETVGVGQSEIAVRSMVDFFLLVLIAGAGDELQGMKKGVMEMADAVVVNKADGPNFHAAQLARAQLESALHYMPSATSGWTPPVLSVSALQNTGLDTLWEHITRFFAQTRQKGILEARRQEQTREWLHAMLEDGLKRQFYQHHRVKAALTDVESRVMNGDLPVAQAAYHLLDLFLGNDEPAINSPLSHSS